MALAEIIPTEQPTAHVALMRWLASHCASTADTYRRALELVPLVSVGTRDLTAVSWDKLDGQALGRVREMLFTRFRPATVNRTLRAVRSLARALEEQGVLRSEQLTSILRVRDMKAAWSASKTGRMLDASEQRRLMRACDKVLHAPKFHRALVALLLAGGLRKSEAAGFLMSDLRDYDTSTGMLLVRHGKGRKQRTVYFTGTAKAALDDFVADDDRGWRFRKLATSQVGFILQRLRRRAKIDHCSPHDMRRTFASGHFARGTDIATIQELMGHASPKQTAEYDRRGESRKVAAAYDPWGEK